MKYSAILLLIALALPSSADERQAPFPLDKQIDLIKPNIEYRGNDALAVLEGLIYLLEHPTDPREVSIALINTNEPTFKPGDIFDRSLPMVTNQPYLEIYLRNSTFRYLLDYITKSLNLHYKVTASQILIFTEDGIPLRKQ